MKVYLKLIENREDPEWSSEKFSCSNDFYHIIIEGSDRDEVINCCKANVLTALAYNKVVPNKIEFVIEDMTVVKEIGLG